LLLLLEITSSQGLWQRGDRSVTAWLCCLHSELHKPQLQPWITHLSPQPPLLCLLWVLCPLAAGFIFIPLHFSLSPSVWLYLKFRWTFV
jgi:hypothetical protein